jgi:hypothetical protein
MVVGYRLWIAPRVDSRDLPVTAVLALVMMGLLGGFFGAPPWWLDEEGAFSWDLPPLASRMLGAAAFSFVVAALYVLLRPSLARLQLYMLLLAVYLAPLVIAIVLFHLDRFDFSRLITVGFFTIAGGMAVVSLYFLVRPPETTLEPAIPVPPPAVVRSWLLLVAVVTLIWGLALFVTDDGGSKLIWAWQGDLLSSRLIGVMLLTISLGSLWSLRSNDTAQMMLAMNASYGLLIALASLWQTLLDAPIREAYLVVFGIIGVVSAVLVVTTWRALSEPSRR